MSAALLLGCQALMAGNAWAHSLEISASASCVDGVATIEYTVTEPNGYAHNNIEVTFNGVYVGTGAVSFYDNSFSGTAPAPSGSVVVTATAVGPWVDGTTGGQTASTTVDVPSNCTPPPPPSGIGRFTGGGKQVDLESGVTITKGLTIHCDLLLSNNLELNWNQVHKFHMEEHLVTLECSDNPLIEQRPPAAPIDTLVGRGIGRYDGKDGYTVEFKLVDAGEPGRNDQAAFKIYETANPSNVVLNFPLTYLKGGNLQAHYDQPHK